MKASTTLPKDEILAILRAADTIIMQGGRTLLAKILKGSREKKLLELELDECPTYGYFKGQKLEHVIEKIDWMIEYDFLEIHYRGKLPMIVFTERGWKIEADQRANEFLAEWDQWLEEDKAVPDMTYLTERNREMMFLFLTKVKETGNTKYIPFLEAWAPLETRKVKAAIQDTIKALENKEPIDRQAIKEREELLNTALKGQAPQDLRIKCMECGSRFTLTIGEQQFYKQKGFSYPRRCKRCRNRNRGYY